MILKQKKGGDIMMRATRLFLVGWLLAGLLFFTSNAFAWNTSYVYFEVYSGSRICSDVIVNTSTQEAKYYKGKPYTTERVGDCIDYKVMGVEKFSKQEVVIM